MAAAEGNSVPSSPGRLRILSVGSNAISAFLTWRLTVSNACDVTLVWKTHYETVNTYGISYKSVKYGTERFKPAAIVRSVDEAVEDGSTFDYVLLCVKALPDVYDLAAIVEPAITSSQTCIVVNTTNSIGVEQVLETAFPKNLVLSLVVDSKLDQLGPADFEQCTEASVFIGNASKRQDIPAAVEQNIAEAFAVTLDSALLECKISHNIRQQQWGNLIGPIAFHPISVLLNEPLHADLLAKPLIGKMICSIIDELLQIAESQGCMFAADVKQKTLDKMTTRPQPPSIMYQDYSSRRPMEVQVLLANPVAMAKEGGVETPHLEMVHALLQEINATNQTRLPVISAGSTPHSTPPLQQPSSFASSQGQIPQRAMGPPRQQQAPMRPPSSLQPRQKFRPMPARNRSEPPADDQRGYPPQSMARHSLAALSPASSYDDPDAGFEEFASIAMYGDMIGAEGSFSPPTQMQPPPPMMQAPPMMQPPPIMQAPHMMQGQSPMMQAGNGRAMRGPEGSGYSNGPCYSNGPAYRDNPGYDNGPAYRDNPGYGNGSAYRDNPVYGNGPAYRDNPAYRDREMPMMQQRDMPMRNRDMRSGSRLGPSRAGGRYYPGDDDDNDEYVDPGMHSRPMPPIDPDNFDMMTVTNRMNRRAASAQNLRRTAGMEFLPSKGSKATLANALRQAPRAPSTLDFAPHRNHTSIFEDPLLSATSNRYPTVDTKTLTDNSRANSMNAQSMHDGSAFHQGPQLAPGPMHRRESGQGSEIYNRGASYPPPPSPSASGRIQPLYGQPAVIVRSPVPRYPVENKPFPMALKSPNHLSERQPKPGHRSLTGSASASAESHSNGSGNYGEGSGHSSSSSLDRVNGTITGHVPPGV